MRIYENSRANPVRLASFDTQPSTAVAWGGSGRGCNAPRRGRSLAAVPTACGNVGTPPVTPAARQQDSPAPHNRHTRRTQENVDQTWSPAQHISSTHQADLHPPMRPVFTTTGRTRLTPQAPQPRSAIRPASRLSHKPSRAQEAQGSRQAAAEPGRAPPPRTHWITECTTVAATVEPGKRRAT